MSPDLRDCHWRVKKILIASGASAGHLYPALALAEILKNKQPSWEITFVTSRRLSLEKLIKSSGYKVFIISICPFSRPARKFLISLYRFVKSFLETFLIIEKFRPDVVIGFGSYVSFPVILESALFKKPTLIHEQNVSLGLSNRVLSLFVDRVAVSFADERPKKDALLPARASRPFCRRAISWGRKGRGKFVFTGNPLRQKLVKKDKEESRAFFGLDEKFTILVLGGSQGSERINSEFKKAVDILSEKTSKDFQFIHLCGKKDYSRLKKDYSCIKIRYCLFDFLTRIDFAYSLADLVICRAGAASITELAFFRKAAILIPYPYAGSHQLENASALKMKEAAVCLEEKECGGFKLAELILRLMDSSVERVALEKRVAEFVNPNAGEKLAELAVSLIN